MQFKSLIQESYLHNGIERLSRKLHRSKSEKERLEEMQFQLGEINRQKMNLRRQFQNRLVMITVQREANLTVFKDILNEMRRENENKVKRIDQNRRERTGRIHLQVTQIRQTAKVVQEASKVNAENLAAFDKMTIFEESVNESLEFVRQRLNSDLKNIRGKIDRLNHFKMLTDRNLRLVLTSHTQIHLKRVGLIDIRDGTAPKPANDSRRYDQASQNDSSISNDHTGKTEKRNRQTRRGLRHSGP